MLTRRFLTRGRRDGAILDLHDRFLEDLENIVPITGSRALPRHRDGDVKDRRQETG